jgi:hypothetical protein
VSFGQRRLAAAERNPAPIEMRFVDMFMTALGALVFMAMLLAYLLSLIPSPALPNAAGDPVVPIPPGSTAVTEVRELALVTKTLPRARIGDVYDVAIAYRGGRGAIRWDVAAGAEEFPHGLRLEPESGMIQGTPREEGKHRFVVRARDARGSMTTRALELVVEPRPKSTAVDTTMIAVSLSLLTGVVTLVFSALCSSLKRFVATLQEAHRAGQLHFAQETGSGVVEYIDLPDGITTYLERLRGARALRAMAAVVFLGSMTWLAVRLWVVSPS